MQNNFQMSGESRVTFHFAVRRRLKTPHLKCLDSVVPSIPAHPPHPPLIALNLIFSWYPPPGTKMFNNAARRLTIRYPGSRQYESTALHFYQNRQLEIYASKEAKRLTLRQLVRRYLSIVDLIHTTHWHLRPKVFFGRSMDQGRLIKVL